MNKELHDTIKDTLDRSAEYWGIGVGDLYEIAERHNVSVNEVVDIMNEPKTFWQRFKEFISK